MVVNLVSTIRRVLKAVVVIQWILSLFLLVSIYFIAIDSGDVKSYEDAIILLEGNDNVKILLVVLAVLLNAIWYFRKDKTYVLPTIIIPVSVIWWILPGNINKLLVAILVTPIILYLLYLHYKE